MKYGHLLISLHNITWSICGIRLTDLRATRRFDCVWVCHRRCIVALRPRRHFSGWRDTNEMKNGSFVGACVRACAQIQRLTYFKYDELMNRFWHVGVGRSVRMEWIEAMWWQRGNSSVVNKESQCLYSASRFPGSAWEPESREMNCKCKCWES